MTSKERAAQARRELMQKANIIGVSNSDFDRVISAAIEDAIQEEAQKIGDLLYKTTEALVEMAKMYGGKHEKDCPQDDTCDCHYAAFNKMVNDAVKAAYDHFQTIGREVPQ